MDFTLEHEGIIKYSRRSLLDSLAELRKIRFDVIPTDLDETVWNKLLNATEYIEMAIRELDRAERIVKGLTEDQPRKTGLANLPENRRLPSQHGKGRYWG